VSREDAVKNFSEFVTAVAAAVLGVAASALPAAAADRPAGDTTQPTQQYPFSGQAARPPQSGVHADYHTDARVGGTDRPDPSSDSRGGGTGRNDTSTDSRVREDARDERLERWTPRTERHTRPQYRWPR
jgi:hypothetical protein